MTIVAGSSDKTTITVDGKVLCTTTDEIALIGSGCRCCTIRSDLVRALRGRATRSDRVVIETSEHADRLSVLRTFMSDRGLGSEFHVDDNVQPTPDCSSFALIDDRPVAWESFSRAMETLVTTRGADLTLARGLLGIEGARGPVAVHYMQHLALPPVELAAWPDNDRRHSRLTFITRNLPEAAIRALLDSVRAIA